MLKVQVLMSTYNGSKYIDAQLISILNQTYSNITILIRDDGSTDNTKEYLERYMSQYPSIIKCIFGDNLGVIRSFFNLLDEADKDCEYFAFCDQDDFWLPDKIERAVNKLELMSNTPAMICTATQITDAKLQTLRLWPTNPRRSPSFYNALVQNIAVGATITLNRRALDVLSQERVDPNHIQMHDWWAYLCVSAFGKVIFDPVPSILYRQHANNAVGGEASLLASLQKKWSSFQKHKGKRLLHKQAMEFHRIHGEHVEQAIRTQLELFIQERGTLVDRVAYLKDSRLYRNSLLEQLLFRVLILAGYI